MKKNFLALYAIAILQGATFTTIPAASLFITAPKGLNLSSEVYGSIFLPMVIAAIVASFIAGFMGKRFGLKPPLLLSILSSSLGMLLFASMMLFGPYRIHLLYLLMSFLGAGFGAMISVLNPYVIYYFPSKANCALTALHATLGIGTAVGPLLFSSMMTLGVWQVDPLILIALYAVFALITYHFVENPKNCDTNPTLIKNKVSNFVLIAFGCIAIIYGFLETSFSNWAIPFLFKEQNISYLAATYSLSLFWFFITFGRVIAAFITARFSAKWIYRILPGAIMLSLFLMDKLKTPVESDLVFALAGIGCSCFLPLTIAQASKRCLDKAPEVSGALIALYMTGYALASEGYPLMQSNFGTPLGVYYTYALAPALLLAILASYVTKGKKI